MRRSLLVLPFLLVAPLTLPGAATAASTTAPATVFAPNPVAQLQDQTLTDQKDADYPALQRAYVTRTLSHLDGSGFLHGDYAYVDSGTGPLAQAPFTFHRDDDRFEQVMAYYWATQAQLYLQELGFTDVNAEPQRMKIDQYGVDNSYFDGAKKDDLLKFGKGGVDDAEDAEVVLHEYGHAIQDDQVPGFGSTSESGAIGEGFGDYWAVAVTDRYAATPDTPCVADWDAVSYTSRTPHCLRRTDSAKTYPASLRGEVHADGEIWSSALYGMRTRIGAPHADRAIILAHESFTPAISMRAAAATTIATVKALYGTREAGLAKQAFAARGLA
ncbi:MAG: bacillolysin [Frankiales bacterium]|nr:bacillolysin [Frankiales bacterium]